MDINVTASNATGTDAGGCSLFLLKESAVETVDSDFKKKSKEALPQKKKPVRCRACGTVVTSLEQTRNVDGSHRHTFQNPAGFIFDIGCFSEAHGCVVVGPPTLEHTWFPGYAWSYAFCSGCTTHLGWFWSSASEGFFGLIMTKLSISSP